MVEERQKRFRGAILDTLNQIQQDQYTELLRDKGKAGFDEWKDFGVEVMDLYLYIKKQLTGSIIVQISGYEGSGKSCGALELNSEEFYYLNADKKPLTFDDTMELYPPDGSKKNYKEVSSYEDVKTYLKGAYDRRKDGPFIIFILVHIEDFKSKEGIQRQRMKTLGKMATKNNIEGSLVHCYYTKIDPSFPFDSSDRYRLEVFNDGFNTARSPMKYFTEFSIRNSFQIVVDKILEKYKIIEQKEEIKK